jgi:PKD repeat protein
MKKYIIASLVSAFIMIVLLIGSCSKSSTFSACIGALPSSASVGTAVNFSSYNSGAGSYTWHFSDGTTGSGQTTIHIYTTTGTYNGSLTVTSGNNTATKNFTINAVANNWTFNGSSFVADSVTVSASAGTVSAGGAAGSNTANLTFVFYSLPTATGTYPVVNAAANNVGPGQVYVVLNNYVGTLRTIYGSTGTGNINAANTVTGGKIAVVLPAIELVNQSNASDSASLSATITQTQ